MKILMSVLLICSFAKPALAVFLGDLGHIPTKSVLGYKNPEIVDHNSIDTEHGLVLEVEFLMSGCKNEITPLNYTLVESDGNLVIVLSAMEIEIQESNDVVCIEARTLTKKTLIPMSRSVIKKYQGRTKVQFTQANQSFQIMSDVF